MKLSQFEGHQAPKTGIRLQDLFPTQEEPAAPKKAKKDDLFEQFDLLFQHVSATALKTPPPHPVVLNRFLASDRDYAEAAKFIALHTWDPAMTWEIWKGAVPKAPRAPRMKYVAAKKLENDEMVERVIAVEHCKRDEAEMLVGIVSDQVQGGDPTLYKEFCGYYGIDDKS